MLAHRWSSLLCTAFVLLLCLTGLPLIFAQEISRATGVTIQADVLPPHTPPASLDRVVEAARGRHPGTSPLFASQEAGDDRIWFVTLAAAEPGLGLKQVAVDSRSARALGEPVVGQRGFMRIVRSLHVDLFAGLAGSLFLGAMGLVFLLALVSGTVLYAPFMRRLEFGSVRGDRGRRVRWLDLHNLIGIATLTWAGIVAATGVVNTGADLLVARWQSGEISRLARPSPLPAFAGAGGAQRAVTAAQMREPRRSVAFVAFPGSSFATPRHFGVYMRGRSALTARVVKPVLVDAGTGEIRDGGDLPWYLAALFVSQPLHFGDYGGLPLKVLWAALDLATLAVVGGGLYLWLARRARAAQRRVVS